MATILNNVLERFRGNPLKIQLTEAEVMDICLRAREQLMKEKAFVEVEAPLTICGDIHGQFPDLIQIFEKLGHPPQTRYLFLGDYVDRGRQGIETITLLLAYKLKYPNSIYLLRGNHESEAINKIYGFLEECKRRFNVKVWKVFGAVFNSLPFCALVASRIFCMHGGLSAELVSWEQLRRMERPCEIPDMGLLCDLVWADPVKNPGYHPSPRGIAYVFGPDVVKKFCSSMDIDLVVRAHQVVQNGYEFAAERRLITVFSVPNYCGEFSNDAAMLQVTASLRISVEIIKAKNMGRPGRPIVRKPIQPNRPPAQ